MLLLKYDPNQNRITDFYSIADKVEEMISSSPKLVSEFQFSTICADSSNQGNGSIDQSTFHSFFAKLVENAYRNVDKSIPQARRYDAIVKKFATSLLLYSGPMAYSFIQKNMENALPSIRTVQRIIQTQYHLLSEGEFQFDGLLQHLTKYKAPLVIAVSEDATRITSRVEYDKETDRMVGFILPCNEDGLPLPDSHLATSFQTIEDCFNSCQVSKYAYLYVAQCVSPIIPPFCLACMGNTTTFTALEVLKRWRYIYQECLKRGITIISFGADGDSRLLRAMKISTQLNLTASDKALFNQSPSSLTLGLRIPKDWTWFWVERATTLLYIQDYIHVAVKLKSRLLKPSIILPLGEYLAGSHHLRYISEIFTKDQHGLRQQDIDHKDKQNFDAVIRITSPSVLSLLEKIPDAKGTLMYLKLLKKFMDAFLDKSLAPLERIQNIWYVIFFLRYWHRWLCLKKQFTVKENFITSNAMSGIEMNGHALVALVILLRDVISNGNELFCPWLLGSQPCEQTFRAARSMTGMFSTVINFSMFGMLNRLHRLQIQLQLESEMKETGIQYPRVVKHIKKSGFSAERSFFNLSEITNKKIFDAVQRSKVEAISSLEELGIFVKDKDGNWQNLTIKMASIKKEEEEEDDDENDEDYNEYDGVEEKTLRQNNSTAENELEAGKEEIKNDFSELQGIGLVDTTNLNMTKIFSNNIPLFLPKEEAHEKQKSSHQKKHSEFIPVTHNKKTVYIRKSTALWLFQEFERVNIDRVFRVRSKQLNSSDFKVNLPDKENKLVNKLPQKCKNINVGDFCVFHKPHSKDWTIGKVLYFFYPGSKTSKGKQCNKVSMEILPDDGKPVSVVCTWFVRHPPLSVETLIMSPTSTSADCGIDEYAFTLTEGCFETEQIKECTVESIIFEQSVKKLKLASSNYLIICKESLKFIEENLKSESSSSVIDIDSCSNQDSKSDAIDCNYSLSASPLWRRYGCYNLTMQHRSQLLGGQLLCDIHIGAAQAMINQQFPTIGGLKNTILQDSKFIQPFDSQQNIQIVHVVLGRIDHWIVLSTIDCAEDEVVVYDSLQMNPNLYTQTIISKYLKTYSKSFVIKLANVAVQKGSTDCGLYAIAMMTTVAFNEDPTDVVYSQQDMRVHLEQCFTKGILEKFPIEKKRSRIRNRFLSENIVLVYCKCRLPEQEDGRRMVQCDKCMEWYHLECIELDQQDILADKEWLCGKC